jgi:aspartate/methionine/tyrosine aminotransferase
MRSRGEAVNGALCVGQPDFPPPPEVIAATGEAAQKGLTAYTAIAGTLELRQAICDDLETRKRTKYAPSEIMVACGGKQAIYEVTLALCEAGDEVLVPTPYYTSYPDIVKMSGATPVFVDTTPERCYALEPSAIQAAITERTRMLIVCNPSNPTGGAMDRSQLEAIAALLRKPEYQHIYVLSDEIYERICFDGLEHVSFAALEGMRRRTLTINGFSKSHAMTGYRLGYLAAPASIVKAATKIQSQITSCASSIAQHAGIAALKSAPEPLAAHVVALRRKRDVALKLLEAIPGVTCPTPQGAFYLLPDVSHYFGKKTPSGVAIVDAYSLGLHLLEDYRVALVPGEAFGAPRCLRISYAATEENITDALTKLAECLRRLS